MDVAHRQSGVSLRFEWGLTGARAVAEGAGVAVVVDVLSFTTAVSVAVDLGAEVFPYRWRDDSAAAFAAERDAVLAVGRGVASPGEVSLSPPTIRSATGLRRLVLPSPNGSTIAHSLSERGVVVAAASLRNAAAVARWVASHHGGGVVAVVAAGERWPDGSLRPAVEDLWGAGAVIAELAERGEWSLSPESRMASEAWRAVRDGAERALFGCSSGRELVEAGYAGDVAVAAEIGQSRSAPVLRGGSFRDARSFDPGGNS